LPTRFALALAPAMAATPRKAARLVGPFLVARIAATANQRTPWFADFVRRFRPMSTLVSGRFALRRTNSWSILLTLAPDLRTRFSTTAR
jgi:hypothetical protein